MLSKKKQAPEARTTATLAAKLGLSRWTISRVINGHPGVKPETVARVRQAMSELGYEPNAFARVLRGGRTGMVGVCFQELESPILARKAGLLQEVFREKGYQALIELSNGDSEREAAALRHFLAMRAEGAVLVGSSLTDEKIATADAMPVIWVDPEQAVKGQSIRLDRAHSMKLVLDYLYELGHRTFGVLGIDPHNPYGAFRWPALQQHAKRLSIPPENIYSIFRPDCREHTYDYGRELAQRLLKEVPVTPTAIIALNDRVAIGAINVLLENGLRVPEDISVAGYDNIEVTAHFRPPLTTVDQRAEHLMRLAAEALLARIEGRSSTQASKLVKPRLIVRESTGKAS